MLTSGLGGTQTGHRVSGRSRTSAGAAPPSARAKATWARLIREIYEADPM